MSQGEQHSDTWLEVSVTTSAEAVDAVSEMLMQLGAGGVVVDDPRLLAHRAVQTGPSLIDEPGAIAAWQLYIGKELPSGSDADAQVVVCAYLPDTAEAYDLDALQVQIKSLATVGLDPGEAQVTTNLVQEEDWADAWKRFYTVQRIGRKLVIVPSWLEYAAMPGDLVVQLDPGMAFGTGTHPTTQLCLTVLEDLVKPDYKVLDIGTGSGILAIAAAQIGAMVTAIDIDPRAAAIAGENAAANNVEKRVTTAAGTLATIPAGEKFDLIVANIVADTILAISDDVLPHLHPESHFVASGIVDTRLAEVEAAWQRIGLTVRGIRRLDEWVCLVGSL